jgi:hypothetical protein
MHPMSPRSNAASTDDTTGLPTQPVEIVKISPTARPNWKRLMAFADEEMRAVREKIQKLFPEHTSPPLTLHLYQPVPISADDQAGQATADSRLDYRLVDVGPRPNQENQHLIAQVDGATGIFVQDKDSSKRFVAEPTEITERISNEYREKNLPEWRASQVALEKERYQGIIQGWLPDPAPPIGIYIYQLPLSPLPENFRRNRHPSLGAAYTLSTISNPQDKDSLKSARDQSSRSLDTILQLPLFALQAGNVAIKIRTQHLLGEKRTSMLKDLTTRSTGEQCLVIGSLILAHHWYYFSDPVAHILLHKLSTSRSDHASRSNELLRPCMVRSRFGSDPQLPSAKETETRSIEELFSILCEDIEQIISFQLSYEWVRNNNYRDTIRNASATILTLLTGELYCGYLGSSDSAVTIKHCTGRNHSSTEHFGFVLSTSLPLLSSGGRLGISLPAIKSTSPRRKGRTLEYVEKHLQPLRKALIPFHDPEPRSTPNARLSSDEDCLSMLSSISWLAGSRKVRCQSWKESDSEWGEWLREIATYRIYQEYMWLPKAVDRSEFSEDEL